MLRRRLASELPLGCDHFIAAIGRSSGPSERARTEVPPPSSDLEAPDRSRPPCESPAPVDQARKPRIAACPGSRKEHSCCGRRQTRRLNSSLECMGFSLAKSILRPQLLDSVQEPASDLFWGFAFWHRTGVILHLYEPFFKAFVLDVEMRALNEAPTVLSTCTFCHLMVSLGTLCQVILPGAC